MLENQPKPLKSCPIVGHHVDSFATGLTSIFPDSNLY